MKNHDKSWFHLNQKFTNLTAIIFLLSLSIVVLFSCSKTSDKTEVDADTGYPILSFFHGGASEYKPGSPLEKMMQDKLKVVLKNEFLVGDLPTRSGVLLASGEFPDLMNLREETSKFVEAGAFIPLEDLIDKYAPQIKKLYGPIWNRLKYTDGHIYTLPEVLPIGNGITAGGSKGFWVQKAVLKWAGWPKLKTLDEYFNLLERYKKAFPEINGQKTIGFEPLTEGWRVYYIYSSMLNMAGYPNDGAAAVDEDPPGSGKFKAKEYIDSELTYNVLKQYNDAYLRGILNKDGFVSTFDQYNQKISSGRVLGIFDEGWEFAGAQQVLIQEQPDRVMVPFPLTLTKDQTHEEYETPQSANYGAGVGISITCKDPVLAIKFLDRALQEDVTKLATWGREGIDYEVEENGMFYRTDEQRAKVYADYNEFTFSNLYNPYYPIGVYGTFEDGNATDPKLQPSEFYATTPEAIKEVFDAYGIQSYAEWYNPPTNFRSKYYPLWSIQSDPEKDKEFRKVSSARDDVLIKYFPLLFLADKGDFDNVWKKYIDELYSIDNLDLYIKFYQDKIDERLATW